MNKLTENTLIPIGAVAVFIVAIITVVMWFSTFAAATTANAEVIKTVEARLMKIEEKLINQNEIMIKDLSRIKDRLNIHD